MATDKGVLPADNMVLTAQDILSAPLITPTHKLDADQYMAEDLDGVTESVFGSGNMNFLMLQAGQTDEAIRSFGNDAPDSTDVFSASISSESSSHAYPLLTDTDSDGSGSTGRSADTDRTLDNRADIDSTDILAPNSNTTNASVNSASATALSASAPAASFTGGGSDGDNAASGLSRQDGKSPDAPPPGQNGSNGSNGQNGQNGENGNGHGDIDINLGDITINIDNILIDLGDTVNVLTTSITNVTNLLNNLLCHGNTIDITNIIDLVFDIKHGLLEKIETLLGDIGDKTVLVKNLLGDILGDVKNTALDLDLNVLDTVTADVHLLLKDALNGQILVGGDLTALKSLIADLPALDILADALGHAGGAVHTLQDTIHDALETVTSLPENTVDTLVETLNDLNDQLACVLPDLDEAIGGLIGGLGIGEPGGADHDVSLDIVTDVIDFPVVDTALDIVINPAEDLLGDLDLGIGGGIDLLGSSETDNASGDIDIVLLPDLDLIDNDILDGGVEISLDPVEHIIGDVDLDVTTALDLLGDQADGLIDNAPGGSGDNALLSTLGDVLSGVSETLLPEGDDDQDIFLDTGETLPDISFIDTDLHLDIPIDPVESVLGDIDLDLNDALDILRSDSSNSPLGNITDWTETISGDISGGLFGDILTGGGVDILPEPTGQIAEGLGALFVEPDIHPVGLGRLFG